MTMYKAISIAIPTTASLYLALYLFALSLPRLAVVVS